MPQTTRIRPADVETSSLRANARSRGWILAASPCVRPYSGRLRLQCQTIPSSSWFYSLSSPEKSTPCRRCRLHSRLTFASRASKACAHRTSSVREPSFAGVAVVASLCISALNAAAVLFLFIWHFPCQILTCWITEDYRESPLVVVQFSPAIPCNRHDVDLARFATGVLT